jgi:enoyl-CoA hydratase/carnithine racemase
MSRVTTTITDHVAHVELSRPDKMNAVDPDMLQSIIEAGEALRGNMDVRAIVLSGQGNAFCAGLDVASFAALANGDPMEMMMRRTHGPSNYYQHVAMAWKQLEMPVIAALHGVCFGAGLQIASGADIRIASPDTRMSILEMKWGLVPDMGGMAIWPSLMRADVLRRLTYTGQEFTGKQGQDYGLVTEVSETPVETALALAKLIATKSPSAVRAGKALISYALKNDQDAILLEESRAQASLIAKPDQIEAVMANVQKRAPNFN